MKVIIIDSAPPSVKKFLRSLAIDAAGVEISLQGNVVCKIIPPGQLTEAEKAAQLATARQLLGKARARSKRLSAPVIESRIRSALKAVREGR